MIHALRHPIQFHRDHRFTVEHASDYLDGELRESAAGRVDHHASVCPRCRELLSSLRRTLSGLGALRIEATSETTSPTAAGVLDALRAETRDPGTDPGEP